jgi:hypothetical protein
MGKKKESKMALVELPIEKMPDGAYSPTNVQSQLNREQGKIFRRLFLGLYEGAYRMKDGKYVQRDCDVLRYILDKIAEDSE